MDTHNGISAVTAGLQSVGIDPHEGVQIIGARQLAARHHPPFDLSMPALVIGVTDQPTAQRICKVLGNAYPNNHPLQLISTTKHGTDVTSLPLAALSTQNNFGTGVCVYVLPLSHSSYADLQEVMAHLRAPYGCPWDRKQTLASTRTYLLDEVAEALEAMDAEDERHISEELGDVLGIVAMIAQIATEEGRFQMADAVRLSVEKLVRRHPHVFGEDDENDLDQLNKRWDEIKAEERAALGRPQHSPLDDLPAALPALRKALKMQSKAHKAGLLDRAALAQSQPQLVHLLPEDSDEQALGELLWRLVALASARGLDPEDALRSFVIRWRETMKR